VLLVAVGTDPNETLVALAASDPEEVLEFVFAVEDPAPATPVQPDIDRTARRVTRMINNVMAERGFQTGVPCDWKFVCEFITIAV
jgi:hypothetical protein